MPLLYVHLSIAREAAERLGHPIVDSNLCYYLGGSISPDAHLVCDASRRDTHFFDLDECDCESGANRIFNVHPQLADGCRADDATRCFIAGYLSHLVTDEVWILDIYRPFFGAGSPLSDDPMANVYDRLLQFEVDRRERQDRSRLESIRTELFRWQPECCIDFITIRALRYWREFGCAAVNRDVDVDDFSIFARSFLQPRLRLSESELADFLATIRDRLEWVVHYVSPERIDAFRHRSIERSIESARECLSEDN